MTELLIDGIWCSNEEILKKEASIISRSCLSLLIIVTPLVYG